MSKKVKVIGSGKAWIADDKKKQTIKHFMKFNDGVLIQSLANLIVTDLAEHKKEKCKELTIEYRITKK